tara:strand:- start:4071 stop:4220 length:150 start_codon:yes stop_codon:yes gene_type:complete
MNDKNSNNTKKDVSLDDYFDWIIKNKKRIDNKNKQIKWWIKNKHRLKKK